MHRPLAKCGLKQLNKFSLKFEMDRTILSCSEYAEHCSKKLEKWYDILFNIWVKNGVLYLIQHTFILGGSTCTLVYYTDRADSPLASGALPQEVMGIPPPISHFKANMFYFILNWVGSAFL